MRYSTIVCCLVLFIQGCAGVRPYPESSLAGEEAMCLRWLENIEVTLEEYNVKDPGTMRINGFPQLRVNRFLASMGERATSQNAFAEWLEQMRQLDATGKKLDRGRAASYPTAPSQIPACEITAPGSSKLLALHTVFP
jgi:hypothetical protein